MNHEDIIRMANDVGIKGPAPARQGFKMYANPSRLKRFAALVAAAEREAIAQSLDKQADLACDEIDKQWAQEMAAAVRARGEKA